MVIKSDCFAFKEFSRQPYCNCLTEVKCQNCPFYQHKKDIKNNIFYKLSFKSHRDYIKALEKYSLKYGQGHLEDFEEE